MAILKPFQFGEDICKIFGLDPMKTQRITITIAPDDLVIVEAHLILWDNEAEETIKLMKKYEFTPYAKNEE